MSITRFEKSLKDVRAVLALSVPVIAENLLQTLLGTTDTYFAGQLGDDAIAAIGVTNLVVNLFITLFTAVSVGTTAIIARNIGRGDKEQAGLAARQSVLLGAALGILSGVICLLFQSPVLRITGAQDGVLELAKRYYLVVASPLLFLCLSLVLSSCLRAAGDTKTPMLATGFANLLNIGLDWLFVKAGFGIAGLGLATTLSRAVTAGVLFLFLLRAKGMLRLGNSGWKPDFSMLRSITRIGIPAGVEKLVTRLGQLVYGGMILTLGASAYVAQNVAVSIESYSYIPAMGFGLATATLVGTSLGEVRPDRARRLTFLSDGVATVFLVAVGAVLYLFAPELAALFTDTREVRDSVVQVLRLIAFFQPFVALTQVLTGALQGAGDTRFPVYATFLGMWGLRVGVGYLLAVWFGMGLYGVWCGYALDLVVRGILLLARFLRGRWAEIAV